MYTAGNTGMEETNTQSGAGGGKLALRPNTMDNTPASVFNDILGAFGGGAFPSLPMLPPLQLSQLTYNCMESSEGLHYTFDTPGTKPEDIIVEVVPPAAAEGPGAVSRLYVRTSRSGESQMQDWNTYREERWSGSNFRSIPLPAWCVRQALSQTHTQYLTAPRTPPPPPPTHCRVDHAAVKVAGLANGILSITAPRRPGTAAQAPATRRLTLPAA